MSSSNWHRVHSSLSSVSRGSRHNEVGMISIFVLWVRSTDLPQSELIWQDVGASKNQRLVKVHEAAQFLFRSHLLRQLAAQSCCIPPQHAASSASDGEACVLRAAKPVRVS